MYNLFNNMANGTLEGIGIDIGLAEVDGRSTDALYLSPEAIANIAGLPANADDRGVYNHHHCDYMRCVRRSD